MSFWDCFCFNRTQRLFKRAVVAVQEKRYAEAIEILNEVIRKKPDYFLFHYLRGAARHQSYLQEEAIGDYTSALQLKSNQAASRFNRGLLYWEKQEFEKAVGDFSVAIDMEYDAYAMRAMALAKLGRFEQAEADIAEAIRRKPTDANLWVMRSSVDRWSGNLSGAFADLKEALRLDPDCGHAHNILAWLMATSMDDAVRDGPRAVEHALKAKGKEGTPHPAMIGTLAAAYAEAGQFEEAIRWATHFLENNPPAENVEGARRRLELYRQGKPYREPDGVFETVRDTRKS